MKKKDFLADVQVEGAVDPVTLNEEKKTPAESPTEIKPKEADEKEKPEEGENTPNEDDLPFHKHPRWIERENKLKELEEKYELTTKELGELKTLKEQIYHKETTAKIPDWFVESYGEDQVAWEKYEARQKDWETQFEQRFFEKLEAKQKKKQTEEADKWNKWVDSEIGKLVSDPKVKFDIKEKNALIKTMLEWRPTDENGNFNFHKGYEIYQLQKLKDNDLEHAIARKKLADAASGSPKGEPKQKDYYTSEDLKKGWQSI